VRVAGKKRGPLAGTETVSWDAPANAVSLADLRALNALMAGRATPFEEDGVRNDNKAFGESQAKFDASLAKFAARPRRRKAGPRQRRVGP
jgi:hypothetical protein